MDNLKMELVMKFQNRGHQNFLSTTSVVGSPTDVRPIPHLTPKCSDPIDQAKQSRASCAQLLTATPYWKQLRERQDKKALSLSKKPAIKRLFGAKRKSSSNNGKVSIQE
jgi:hypothetical protein